MRDRHPRGSVYLVDLSGRRGRRPLRGQGNFRISQNGRMLSSPTEVGGSSLPSTFLLILAFDLSIVSFFRPVDCFFPSKEREPSTSRKTSPPASLYKTTRRRSVMPSGEEFPLPIPPRRIQASGTKGDFQGGFPLKTFSSPFFVVSQRMALLFFRERKEAKESKKWKK